MCCTVIIDFSLSPPRGLLFLTLSPSIFLLLCRFVACLYASSSSISRLLYFAVLVLACFLCFIRPPIAAETMEDTKETPKSMMVYTDRSAIITMLNLHLLLQQYHTKHFSKEDDLNNQYMHTFTICEVVHESNIVFLRDQITTDKKNGKSDFPLLQSGSIFSHTLLDALMVKAVFTPDILAFWEALTGIEDCLLLLLSLFFSSLLFLLLLVKYLVNCLVNWNISSIV